MSWQYMYECIYTQVYKVVQGFNDIARYVNVLNRGSKPIHLYIHNDNFNYLSYNVQNLNEMSKGE